MPRDVHKSLELLEEYHAELFRPADTELKRCIEKVIALFKTNLFNALCDIQEFYDSVLLNERLPLGEKVNESRRFAANWEQHGAPSRQPFHTSLRNSSHITPSKIQSRFDTPKSIFETAPLNRLIDEYGREWEVEEVILDASETGLGFSISGGRDRDPDPDHYIRVTDISPGGAVARDKRIKVGDVILQVNGVDCVNVDHQFAVGELQKAGTFVKLLLKRLKPQKSQSRTQLNEQQYQQQQQIQQRTQAQQQQQQCLQDSRVPILKERSKSLHQLPQQPSSSITQPANFYTTPNRQSFYGASSSIPQTLPESTKAPRVVTLRKSDAGLGFNIVGGEDSEPIYVSHIMPGGAADINGNIKKGDVLLRVGDIDLQGASHSQAANTLKSIPSNTFVHLLIQYRPREFHQFEDKVERARNEFAMQQKNAGYR